MSVGADIRVRPTRNRRTPRWYGRFLGLSRRHLRIAAFTLSAPFAAWGLHSLLAPGRFPVRSVRVVGRLGHIPQPLLVAALRPFLSQDFYTLPLDQVGAAVKTVPWVGSVRVERRFPRTLVIHVKRLHLKAQWAGGGWLDAQGLRAHLDHYEQPKGLPLFQGPAGTESAMWTHYGRFEALLKPVGLTIATLKLSDRGAWRATLKGGPKLVLGHDSYARLARFVAVFPQLESERAKMRQVDLRYTNGFAIGWKTGSGDKND